MIEKIKDINPSIPGMLIVQMLYLIVGEALIICIAKTPLKPAIGFVAGVAYAVFSTFHMSLRIRKVVYGGANTSVTFILGYVIRLIVMLVMFTGRVGVMTVIGTWALRTSPTKPIGYAEENVLL